jgi:amino acid transporter
MAIYPTLFVLYLARLVPSVALAPTALGAAFIGACAAYNLAGARAIGQGSAAMTVLLLVPFAALAVLALTPHGPVARVAPPQPLEPGSPDVAGAVLIVMWNTMGWDNASTIAGEVSKPQRTYPAAVFAAAALVSLTYVVPLAAMRAGGVDPSCWTTGAWVDAARRFGGAPLAVLIVAGGMLSAFGMFNALCMSYARLPAVLADDGHLPRVLSRRLPRGGAPWVAVVACAAAWMLSLGLSFERLVCLDILLYGTSLVLEFVALVVLRVREPDLPRPFRAPGGLAGAVALGVGPLALLGVALVKNAGERVGGMSAIAFGAGLVAAGPLVYLAAPSGRSRRQAG